MKFFNFISFINKLDFKFFFNSKFYINSSVVIKTGCCLSPCFIFNDKKVLLINSIGDLNINFNEFCHLFKDKDIDLDNINDFILIISRSTSFCTNIQVLDK